MCSDINVMHVCFKFCKTLQIVVNNGWKPWLMVDPHSKVHLQEHPEDFTIVDPLSILCGLEKSVLRGP